MKKEVKRKRTMRSERRKQGLTQRSGDSVSSDSYHPLQRPLGSHPASLLPPHRLLGSHPAADFIFLLLI